MSRAHQVIRAWIVAATAVGLGAASHTWAGGSLAHPLILALATALAAFLTLGITQLKLSRVSLAGGVLAGQGLLHTLYSHGASVNLQGGDHHGAHQLTVTAQASHPVSAGMWAGHLLVAALTFAVLAFGEHLLYLLLALVDAGARGLLPALRLRPLPRRLPVGGNYLPTLAAISAWLGKGLTTRGPPIVLAPAPRKFV